MIKEEKNNYIKKTKLNILVIELYEGLLRELAIYITYTWSLGFKDIPDYAYLR